MPTGPWGDEFSASLREKYGKKRQTGSGGGNGGGSPAQDAQDASERMREQLRGDSSVGQSTGGGHGGGNPAQDRFDSLND